jgi:rare lipoprotein A (peptidoglycan hydrolase)
MLARNSVLIGAAVAALVAIGLGASASVSVANASPVKERVLKSVIRAAHDDISMGSADASAPTNYNIDGTASWYGGSLDGRLDARGERFDSHAMTAAHRTLPLNSLVAVTNLENGRRVLVRITDRGPYAHRRVIDLSRAAADALGYVGDGTARVNVRAVAAE